MKTEHETVPNLLELLDEPDPSSYRRLLRDARTSHRCPVLLNDGALHRCGLPAVDEDPALVDLDPHTVLSEWWSGPCLPDCPCDEPLAAALPAPVGSQQDLSRHHATIASATRFARAAQGIARMGVVDAARPADVPLALRWSGMCNYRDRDLPRATAVLRSWEERFGAVVAFVGPDTLLLSVARPPRSVEECTSVAAEHFAFCPDQVDPQVELRTGPIPLSEYAESISGETLWRFWWD
ncbi:DUF4253 domain-containing protein [Actinomycetospora soli]|uniref:DUF4253 domain-containing protein n=1 Tax=Actinomycetospora soli TaxID=2893887 RepID=UPI001E2DF00E|nr:DUF4253 domain-containing protein [Actinomycetospora soli]MCD2186584.1 DUF4253 domain-containing protein [Actinomycetospora soli]